MFNCKPALDVCFLHLNKETPGSLYLLGMCTQSLSALHVLLGVFCGLESSRISLDSFSMSTSTSHIIVFIFPLGPALAQPLSEDNLSFCLLLSSATCANRVHFKFTYNFEKGPLMLSCNQVTIALRPTQLIFIFFSK